MSEIDVVWLIDLDPPSDIGGDEKGFYPASCGAGPPDEAMMRQRCDAVLKAVCEQASGCAVVTVHTSPRHRTTMLEGPYPDIWRRFQAAGAALALHPHEERPDRTTLYDDKGHIFGVVKGTVALARREGLAFDAFRSGTFSFNPALPHLLVAVGIPVDLSAAPGLRDTHRSIDWPARSAEADVFLRDGVMVVEVPMGWDGKGSDLGANYLFNERMDLVGLMRVWDAVRARAAASDAPLLVNFLCHGFGLANAQWQRQAFDFIAYVRRHGGRLVGVDHARRRLDRPFRSSDVKTTG